MTPSERVEATWYRSGSGVEHSPSESQYLACFLVPRSSPPAWRTLCIQTLLSGSLCQEYAYRDRQPTCLFSNIYGEQRRRSVARSHGVSLYHIFHASLPASSDSGLQLEGSRAAQGAIVPSSRSC